MKTEPKLKGIGFMTLLLFLILIIATSTPETKKTKYPVKYWFDKKLDDTDDFTSGKRSGLGLYIDHGTGVHYIRTTFGSLVPRLDKDGGLVTEYQQPEKTND